MATFSALISPDDLRCLLESGHPVVVDCRFSLADPARGRADYLRGHIPRAVYAHLDDDLAGSVRDDSGRHPLPDVEEFVATLCRWGISNDSQVVAYDDAGGAIAARLWWMLRWLGHDAVAVLDGGIGNWLASGGQTDTIVPSAASGHFAARPDNALFVSTAEVAERLEEGRILLVDARDERRFRGEVEPIDTRAGHVPGARNLPFTALLAEDGRFRDAAEIRHTWNRTIDMGRKDHGVVVMCGSGVTACHLALGAKVAGIAMPRLYPGSWSEWIRDPGRPIAAGSH